MYVVTYSVTYRLFVPTGYNYHILKPEIKENAKLNHVQVEGDVIEK